jgi:O-antigen/teichoic acid export membrane protein
MPATVATTLLIQVVTLGSGIILARSLGPSDRGVAAAAMLWPTLLASIGGLGIAEGVTFFSAREAKGPSPILTSSLALGAVQTVALLFLGSLLLPLFLAGKAAALSAAFFYLLIIPLYPLTLYPISLLQGRMNLGAFNVTRLSVHVAYTGLLIALWTQKAVTVRSALAASLAATVITATLSFWLISRRGYWVWRIESDGLRALAAFGAKLHLGNVATIIASKLDIVVLTIFASAQALGIYVVATAVGTVVGLVPGAIAMVLYPRFARLSREDRQMTLSRLLLVGITVTFSAGPVMAIVLPRLIPLVFGRGFVSAVPVAEVLVVGYLLRGYNGILVAMLRGSGLPLRASTGEMIGLILFAVCLPGLTGRFGSVGTATALTIAAAAALVWMVIQAGSAARLSLRRLWSLWRADITWLAESSRGRPKA